MLISRLAILLAFFAAYGSYALSPLTFKGSKIFRSDGSQFFIKGVAYQLTPEDPLIDTDQCTQDANLMKTLGTNSIRVYHVDPYIDHSGCMSVFEDAGIYVWLDLDTFNTTIQQANPYWSTEQYAAFAFVMDSFASYDNIAGFWIGNEVINSASGSPAAPYLKAAIADLRAYRDSKGYRDIPIGYSAADIAELRPMLQNYLACGDASSATDFFGLNSYEWCGTDATYNTSGYATLNEQAQGYSVPIFFSETGCNVGGERTFSDQAAILGPDMDETWSGAIIYEWIQEANDYGLISYPGGGVSGTPTGVQPDFENLSQQWATLSPTGISMDSYTSTAAAPQCPSYTAGGWEVDGSASIPTLGLGALSAKPSLSVQPAPTSTVATSGSSAQSISADSSSQVTAASEVAKTSTTSTATGSASTASSTKEAAGIKAAEKSTFSLVIAVVSALLMIL